MRRHRRPRASQYLISTGRRRAAAGVGLLLLGILAGCSSASAGRQRAAPPTYSSTPSSIGERGPSALDRGFAPAQWTTYQGDRARSGRSTERLRLPLAPAWRRSDLDGAVYAQPLVTNTAVIVATESDSVYGLDPATGRTRWRATLGSPVPSAELPCGNIDPVGITSTPVVDASAGVVWVVAFVQPHTHELVAVDLSTGTIRSRRQVDPPGSDPAVQSQRAALTLSGGRVYVAFGGRYGDCGEYRGWVVAAPTDGGPLLSWRAPTEGEGGIWAPEGPAVDSAGRVFVTTGNSTSTNTFDHGNSVVRLSPSLVEEDTFAPADWVELNRRDSDLGSTGPALVSANQLFQIGKAGVGYLLRADHLGGVGGQIFSAHVCSGAYGATAWAPPLLFIPCLDGLVAVKIGQGTFSVAWRGPHTGVGPPVVTDGVVWTIELQGGRIDALSASDGSVKGRSALGQVPNFAAPAVGDGRLVAPSGHGVVAFTG